jgi:hypothetical protein
VDLARREILQGLLQALKRRPQATAPIFDSTFTTIRGTASFRQHLRGIAEATGAWDSASDGSHRTQRAGAAPCQLVPSGEKAAHALPDVVIDAAERDNRRP